MPFTMPNTPILTPEQASPFHMAMQTALRNYSNINKAKYQPRMMEAEIFGKQFAPLAQIASNPAAMAMMGDQGQGIMQAIQQMLKQQQGGQGGGSGGGLLSNLFGGSKPQAQAQGESSTSAGGQAMPSDGQPSTDQTQPSQQGGQGTATPEEIKAAVDRAQKSTSGYSEPGKAENGNNAQGYDPSNVNIPATDTAEAVKAKALGKYTTQPYENGVIVRDPKTGQSRQLLPASNVANATAGMSEIQAALPLAEKVKAEAADLLKDGKNLKLAKSLIASGAINIGMPAKVLEEFGLSRDFADKYHQMQIDQKNLAAKIGTAYKYGDNLAGEEKAVNAVTNGMFQSGDAYQKQMDFEIANLKQQNEIYKQNISGGQSLKLGAAPEVPKVPGQQAAPSAKPNLPPAPAGKIYVRNKATGDIGLIKENRKEAYLSNNHEVWNG